MNLKVNGNITFEDRQLLEDFIKAINDLKDTTNRLTKLISNMNKIEVGLKKNDLEA